MGSEGSSRPETSPFQVVVNRQPLPLSFGCEAPFRWQACSAAGMEGTLLVAARSKGSEDALVVSGVSGKPKREWEV